jgi:hypothetical protein
MAPILMFCAMTEPLAKAVAVTSAAPAHCLNLLEYFIEVSFLYWPIE